MPTIQNLKSAKKAKADEFYTQYNDIQNEMNAYLAFNPNIFKDKIVLLPCDDPEWSNFTKYFVYNFNELGLKKLISTSYANNAKPKVGYVQTTLFELNSDEYDENKTDSHGKIFTLSRRNKPVKDVNDLNWRYLEGDGDFRSDEVKALRDVADIIITNPPFSLFREFVAWIMEANKQFIIIGNVNAISYNEIFPLLKNNKMWLGYRFNKRVNGKNMTFRVPDSYEMKGTELYINEKGEKFISVAGTGWFTNVDLKKRHEKIEMMTMEDNIKFNKKVKDSKTCYLKYDNYDALNVDFSEAVPSDYNGVMGVPITFLTKFNPEQFDIIGLAPERLSENESSLQIVRYENAIQHKEDGTTCSGNKVNDGPVILHDKQPDKFPYYTSETRPGKFLEVLYARVLIKHHEEKL